MVVGVTDRDTAVMSEIRTALRGPNAAIHLVYVFNHGTCAQVMVKSRKVGPVIIPSKDQTLGTVLAMLGELVDSDPGNPTS